MWTTSCSNCGSKNLKVNIKNDHILYGTLENADKVDIATRIPVFACGECGFQFTDWIAEIINDNIVQAYLYLIEEIKQSKKIREQITI